MANPVFNKLAEAANARQKKRETTGFKFAGFEFEPVVRRKGKIGGKSVTPLFPSITFRKKRKSALLGQSNSTKKARSAKLLGFIQKRGTSTALNQTGKINRPELTGNKLLG